MKLGKETTEKYCKFNVEFENGEFKMLKDYGLKEIQKDDSALINYAVNKILIDSIKRRNNESKSTRKTKAAN